jgi:hypothetical protein
MRLDIHALPSRRKVRCVQSSGFPMLAATGATRGIHIQQAQAATTFSGRTQQLSIECDNCASAAGTAQRWPALLDDLRFILLGR